MKGIIFDTDTKEPLKATIQVTENENDTIQVSYTNNPETGKYLIFLSEAMNSTAIFDADGYLPHFESISLAGASPSVKLIQKDIALQKLKIGERGIFKNILFEFGKDNLRPESVPELLRIVDLMERYPAMEMEVQGHCDHIGSKIYNQKLSEKRAGSVVRYLTASGVMQSRIIAVGKGEDFPVAPNVNSNGTDNPEGRMLNRRTEFLIQKLN
jgi:outer membrane protein OmpA-like peptidoglycan-associated protein